MLALPPMPGRRQLMIIALSGIGLFALNNILIARLLSHIGGSATGLTTMAVMAFLAIRTRWAGTLPFVYSVYSTFGLLSHLYAGDWLYLLHTLVLIAAAFAAGWVLHRFSYRTRGFFLALPTMLLVLYAGRAMVPGIGIFWELGFGYAGTAIGIMAFRATRGSSKA